jgi:uncharacterized protein (UPF0332 family)
MSAARNRLANARDDLEGDHLAGAASAAYYAMLYADRAALSEADCYAKTHSGVWSLFSEQFVLPGKFDRELAREASAAQTVRELGDYEAKPPSRTDAQQLVSSAHRFVNAVADMLAS